MVKLQSTVSAEIYPQGKTMHQLRLAGLSGGIWALAMLPNGQLVSGGGTGRVQFWDTRRGTLLQEFTEHNADVLTIAVSPDGESVFAAGIDERIAMFRRVTSAHGAQSSRSKVTTPAAYIYRPGCIAIRSAASWGLFFVRHRSHGHQRTCVPSACSKPSLPVQGNWLGPRQLQPCTVFHLE